VPEGSTAVSPGREARLCCVLRPPIAQERLEHRPDGLVRIILKKAYSDGTVAVDMDPLSLLCCLATGVPGRDRAWPAPPKPLERAREGAG